MIYQLKMAISCHVCQNVPIRGNTWYEIALHGSTLYSAVICGNTWHHAASKGSKRNTQNTSNYSLTKRCTENPFYYERGILKNVFKSRFVACKVIFSGIQSEMFIRNLTHITASSLILLMMVKMLTGEEEPFVGQIILKINEKR